MKERQCFRCGKTLDFENYIKNVSQNEQEELTDIWNSDYIEFFCCNCYVFKIKYQPYLEDDDFSYY
ncbi:MAG: hypothetical protein ACFFD7_14350 [Candidatus Thorarchaeota archaeon]